MKHLDVENYQKLVKYDSLFLTIISVSLLIWLISCALLRYGHLGDGHNAWFQIRWWISRLDLTFSTKHWLADQLLVKKRKTELGGTFSVASWMLFLGLLSALLYQIISKTRIEVYGIKATNAPDLVSFTNDLELNITTISGMTCSQIRGLDTVTMDSPGHIDYTTLPLSTFATYSCHNSTKGPVINLKCRNCPLASDHVYISWHFVDIPNKFPATAVGFQFNFTAKKHFNHQQYVNFVDGTVKNRNNLDNTSITYRGVHTNLLKFNVFPRVYLNLNGLKLVQPLFHEFRPGSFARDGNELRSSLQGSNNGLVNVTLSLNFLSAFLVEIDGQKYAGPVSFIAEVGGLYCISIAIFLLLLSLCESKNKRLRTEDQVLLKIRKRSIALGRWDKLRKYVAYTYGCRLLNEDYNVNERSTCCFKRSGSLNRIVQQEQDADLQSLSLPVQASSDSGKNARDVSRLAKGEDTNISIANGTSPQATLHREIYVPRLPPLCEMKADSDIDMSDLRREFHNLYEYNTMLRDKLVHAQSMLDALTIEPSLATLNSKD